jgi:hypothetical protein
MVISKPPFMRRISIMLLVVIGLMTLMPAPAIYPFAGQATVSIQAFDVCHGSSTGINVDMPYSINERCCNLLPPLFTGVQNSHDTPFRPLLITFQDERPPA